MATTSNFGWPTPDDGDAVSQGAAAIRSLGSAVDATVAAGYRYAGTKYFTSSGSFAKADPLGTGDIGLRAVRIRVVGGGGGGGGADATTSTTSSAGAGGGGGGYAERFYTAISSMDASVTVTVGSGGAGSAGANGSNGGASSFGSASDGWEVVAGGGSGGQRFGPSAGADVRPGALGGSATVGTLLLPGGAGTSGVIYIAATGFRTVGGNGGSSILGTSTPGRTAALDSGQTGNAGRNYGGGGGGAASVATNATAEAGGSGAAGIVIVDCFV